MIMNDSRTTERAAWQYDELKINSVMDYTAASQAREYEKRHGSVRNIAQENQNLISRLQTHLPKPLSESKILEIGTGTGAFARTISPLCASVTALDAAQAMLDVAKESADEAKCTNIEFIHAGFLTYRFESEQYDAVVSSLALHHLPDVWKAEALANIFRTLKPGGIFLLVDVMFGCEGGEMAQFVPTLATDALGPVMKEALIGHIAKEYSTLSWIMEAIVRHSGLQVLAHEKFGPVAELIEAQKPE